MSYRDRTYCASPCKTRECERHKDHAPKDGNVSWGMFHVDCPGFVREVKHG